MSIHELPSVDDSIEGFVLSPDCKKGIIKRDGVPDSLDSAYVFFVELALGGCVEFDPDQKVVPESKYVRPYAERVKPPLGSSTIKPSTSCLIL